uniref:Glycine N-acyltransferase-like protein n=1 Tax=Setaria digitata TaxID=48799 RepID=A0A915PZ76_9BILA
MGTVREFVSDDDLDYVISMLYYQPYMIPIYNAVRIYRSSSLVFQFPTNFRIFCYPSVEPKLWFVHSKDPFRIELLNVWSLPWKNINEEEFLDAFNQLTKLIHLSKEVLVVSPDFLSDKISIYVKSKSSYIESSYPTYVYYMDKKQREIVLNEELHLPGGYYYKDNKAEEDAPIISDTWQYGTKGNYQSTAEKLRILPNVIIRYQEKPVAYEMFTTTGFFHHHFVHEEHRRRGLGKLVELRLGQKAIRAGLWPCKTVEPKNELVVAWSNRSPYWNRYNDKHGNAIIVNFILLHWYE